MKHLLISTLLCASLVVGFAYGALRRERAAHLDARFAHVQSLMSPLDVTTQIEHRQRIRDQLKIPLHNLVLLENHGNSLQKWFLAKEGLYSPERRAALIAEATELLSKEEK